MSELRKCNKGFGECYHCDPEPDPPRNAQTELERLTALLEDRRGLGKMLFEWDAAEIVRIAIYSTPT